MALFIASLAFSDADLLDAAKLGVLSASAVAGVAGWLILRRPARAGAPDAPEDPLPEAMPSLTESDVAP